MSRFTTLALAAALTLPATAALAHHGWGWTQDEESRLSGTIEEISFGNPHMQIKLRVGNGRGAGDLWNVDLSPPIVAQGSGFEPGVASAGDTVILPADSAAQDVWLRGGWDRAQALLQPYSSSLMREVRPAAG